MKKKQENFNNTDFILNTEKVNEILEKEKLALPLKRNEKLWFKNTEGVRKSGIRFAMTQEELNEYIKSKLSVYYFAEKYCKIKLEDGTVGKMQLRDYQKDIIKLYTENKYSILMASRQVGKCLTFNTLVNVQDQFGNNYKISLGHLYYNEIKKYRKLTFLERVKVFLYELIEK